MWRADFIVPTFPASGHDLSQVEEVHAAQMRFCNEQLRNDKTRRQLEIRCAWSSALAVMTEQLSQNIGDACFHDQLWQRVCRSVHDGADVRCEGVNSKTAMAKARVRKP
jgi:hypothetical protein